MTVYLRICFSSQPVLLRRRAVRRGANAGPICDVVIHALARTPPVVRHPPTPRSYSPWIKRGRFGGVDCAGTIGSLAQAGLDQRLPG
jgi:hypothetical protein